VRAVFLLFCLFLYQVETLVFFLSNETIMLLYSGDIILLGCPGKLLIPDPSAKLVEAQCGDLTAACEFVYDAGVLCSGPRATL
jgi:hypothetical protein